MNDFDSIARNCLPAVELVRNGAWTLDDMEKWLHAVIANDKEYLDELFKSPVSVKITGTGYNFSAKITAMPPNQTNSSATRTSLRSCLKPKHRCSSRSKTPRSKACSMRPPGVGKTELAEKGDFVKPGVKL